MNANFRKADPAGAYFILLNQQKLDADWEKSFGQAIITFAKEFKHNEDAVEDFNAKYAKNNKNIKRVVYEEKPVVIEADDD